MLRLVHMVRVSRLVEYLLLMEDYLTDGTSEYRRRLPHWTYVHNLYFSEPLRVHLVFITSIASAPSECDPHNSKMPLSEYDGETDSISICSNTVDGELITLVDCYNRASIW